MFIAKFIALFMRLELDFIIRTNYIGSETLTCKKPNKNNHKLVSFTKPPTTVLGRLYYPSRSCSWRINGGSMYVLKVSRVEL